MSDPVRIQTLRPLVRYVDHDHAVIEAHFATLPPVDPAEQPPACRAVQVHLEIEGSDGFHDEGDARLQLHDHQGSLRFEVVHPQRWWPAGMGDQPLYRLSLQLDDPGYGCGGGETTFGLTSIRRDRVLGDGFAPSLLVNGQICDIDSVVVIDQINEKQLLPATGESLLLVRDHFGTELLYDAADRAGILLIQCVPIDPNASFETSVAREVARLAPHPSLAGYYVGHLGELIEPVTAALRRLDPTRTVFRRFPLDEAA